MESNKNVNVFNNKKKSVYIHDVRLGNCFLAITLKVQATTESIGILGFIHFFKMYLKATTNTVKRQPIECKRVFANRISGKDFIYGVYKEYYLFK